MERDRAVRPGTSDCSVRVQSHPACCVICMPINHPGGPSMPSKTYPKLRVAAVQAAPEFLNLDGAIDKTIALMKEAAREGTKLIAFPETWIPGYPWWIWLGAPAWAIMRGFVSRYFDNSLQYGSPEAERLRAAAKRNKMFVALGLSE